MRLPILTILGESFAARMTASLLLTLGVPELVAENLEQYKTAAAAFANDQMLFNDLKSRFRAAVSASSLYDTKGFTRKLEAAFSEMHHRM